MEFLIFRNKKTAQEPGKKFKKEEGKTHPMVNLTDIHIERISPDSAI
jgi:hypothetical protein